MTKIEFDPKYFDLLLCFEKAWEKSNNTFSWSGKIRPTPSYTKATKEFMNSVIAEYLFLKYHVTKGWELSEERLKFHIIQRVLRKGELWDILPGAKEYLEKNGMRDEDIIKYLYETVNTFYPNAYEYVKSIFAVSLTEKEEELFRVAKHVATLIEFDAIKGEMSDINREETQEEIDKINIKVSDYLDDGEMKLFVKLSDAVRLVRWAKYRKGSLFTDAAHMLLTALTAEVITLEYKELKLVDESIDSTRAFFKALLHDCVEVYTGDAPSPCKNAMFFEGVGKKLRKIFEEFEEYVYKKYVFKPMDPLLQDEFKEKVVFDEGDDPVSKIVKNADYFSADIESYIMIVVGVLDGPYFDVLAMSHERADENKANGFTDLKVKSPAATEILRIMYDYSKTRKPAPF